MKRVKFENIQKLAEVMNDYIASNVSGDKYPIISTYAKYDVAKSLVEKLIMLGNPIGNILELEEYEMSHYDKEFYICLTENGVASEKIYGDDCYYYGGGDISFVHEDCNSKLLEYIESDVVCEFSIGESDDDCNDDECKCEYQCDCKKDEENKVEYDVKSDDNCYSISIRCNLDTDEAMEMIKDMEKRMEHMNDMFREMDNWRKLFRW